VSSCGNAVKQETAAHESQRLSYTGILGFTLDPLTRLRSLRRPHNAEEKVSLIAPYGAKSSLVPSGFWQVSFSVKFQDFCCRSERSEESLHKAFSLNCCHHGAAWPRDLLLLLRFLRSARLQPGILRERSEARVLSVSDQRAEESLRGLHA